MKYLFVLLALCAGSAQAMYQQAVVHNSYEITDGDCSALKDVARGITMMRNEGVPAEEVRKKLTTNDNMKRKEYVALLPKMQKIVTQIYDDSHPQRTPEFEADEVYVNCMSHVYGGEDF